MSREIINQMNTVAAVMLVDAEYTGNTPHV